MSWWPVFLIEAVAIVIINGITIATFVSTDILRKCRSYLLVSIAVADLLVGAVSVAIFTATLAGVCCNFSQNWWVAQDSFFGLASVFGLASLSVERMYAVCWPARYLNIKNTAYAIFIGLPWLFALASALVHGLLGANNLTDFYVSMFLLAISLIIIFTSNFAIWMKACSGALGRDVALERKLAITVSVVVMVSMVAWLPFAICNVIIVSDHFHNSEVMYHTLLTTKLFHYGNSLVNPIIYTFMMTDFRRAAADLLMCNRRTRAMEDITLDSIENTHA